MNERIRYYHCCIDDGYVQDWLIDEDDNPIKPVKEKDETKWFSIYRDKDNKELAVSPQIKRAIQAVQYEQLLELGLIDNKKKK